MKHRAGTTLTLPPRAGLAQFAHGGTVTVPRRDGIAALAYLTPAELDYVRRANVGGANPLHRAYRGPGGVPRLDDGGDGSDGGSGSDGDSSGSDGGAFGGEGGGYSGEAAGFGDQNGTAGTIGAGDTSTVGGYAGEGHQTGGAGFGSSEDGGPMEADAPDGRSPASATSGLAFGTLGGMQTAPTIGIGAIQTGLAGTPLGTVPSPYGPPLSLAPEEVQAQQAHVAALDSGFATALGLGGKAAGMFGGLPGGLASMAAQNALGYGVTPSQAFGTLGGLLGTPFGPAGTIAGGVIGSALGATLGAHGNQNDPAGVGMGGMAGQQGTDTSTGGLAAIAHIAARQAMGLPNAGLFSLTPGTAATRTGYAQGGLAMIGHALHHGARMSHRYAHGSGLVPGSSAGRADAVQTTVPQGSYVLPADVVSALGEGNTQSGAKVMSHLLRQQRPRLANGGRTGLAALVSPTPVPVSLSSGEFVVHPDHVAALGGDDLNAGSGLLDQLVAAVRQQVAQSATTLPPPR